MQDADIRIALPRDLAILLIEDGVAVRPPRSRDPVVVDALRLVLDGVNTAASVVTVAVSAEACRRFASRLWARRHRGGGLLLTLEIKAPGWPEPRRLELMKDDHSGEDKILDFVAAALAAATSGS
jgi:hypothetical protein